MTNLAARRRLTEMYRQENGEAAALILSDVLRYGGDASLPVQWARAFVEAQTPTILGPLLERAA